MSPKNTKRVTLKDIAEKTGFSVNTVSKALKDRPDLSVKTKEYIKKVADELCYVTNDIAGSLRSGLTKILALIVSDISNPLFGIIAKEVEKVAQSHQYTVIIMNTEENDKREIQAIRATIAKNVDGVLLVPTQNSTKGIEMLLNAAIPCVLIGRYFKDFLIDSILFADKEGGYLATEHLLINGYRNILMLNAPLYISSARDRLTGYRNALSAYGIPPEHGMTITVDSIPGSIEEKIKLAIQQKMKFDSIFAFSDLIAFETICVLQKMGLRVPEDIAVIGFDDIQSKLPIPFPLTTICAPKTAMAKMSVELLLARISKDYSDYPLEKQFDVKLVIRGSALLKSKEI
jgi:LacI family transcriptional regulator